jgi:hypothetical protein
LLGPVSLHRSLIRPIIFVGTAAFRTISMWWSVCR